VVRDTGDSADAAAGRAVATGPLDRARRQRSPTRRDDAAAMRDEASNQLVDARATG
jgi:hypothetical protein